MVPQNDESHRERTRRIVPTEPKYEVLRGFDCGMRYYEEREIDSLSDWSHTQIESAIAAGFVRRVVETQEISKEG